MVQGGPNPFESPEIAADAVVCGGDGADIIDTFGSQFTGIFYGGKGNDFMDELAGTFHGGQGDDAVAALFGGTFVDGQGADYVLAGCYGTFDGGRGSDSVFNFYGSATLIGVEYVTGNTVQWC